MPVTTIAQKHHVQFPHPPQWRHEQLLGDVPADEGSGEQHRVGPRQHEFDPRVREVLQDRGGDESQVDDEHVQLGETAEREDGGGQRLAGDDAPTALQAVIYIIKAVLSHIHPFVSMICTRLYLCD